MKPKKNDQPEKMLFLVRHAHRDNSVRSKDNGLTAKGWRQAAALLKYFATVEDIAGFELVSSPKLRCLETLQPLSKAANLKIKQSPLLQEQQEQESTAGFHRRLQEFTEWCKASPSTHIVVCSHGDLLPALANQLTGGRLEFKKGSLAAIAFTNKGPILRYLLRPSDIF